MTDEKSVGVVETKYWRFAEPPDELVLRSGVKLGPIDVAYETYGELSPERDNVVLICHALSGDAHVAGKQSPDDDEVGWWDLMVGPGRGIDTDRYFVVCANVIGGCKGSTGPSSLNPKTGQPYGLEFPMVTVSDMVKAQHALLTQHLGIDRVLMVIGGSMGGMQVLQWPMSYPDMVEAAIPVATTSRLNAQGIAFDEVGRQAIYGDPNWQRGAYYEGTAPNHGLAVARMVGHITYLSDQSMRQRFGRSLQDRDEVGYDFGPADFKVESYLRYKGVSFTERFDANSYLYITKAMDYFDPASDHGSLAEAFKGVRTKFLVISYSGDWLFPTYASKEIVRALLAAGVPTTFCELPSDYGHDAFLLDDPQLTEMISGFLGHALLEVRSRPAPSGGD